MILSMHNNPSTGSGFMVSLPNHKHLLIWDREPEKGLKMKKETHGLHYIDTWDFFCPAITHEP